MATSSSTAATFRKRSPLSESAPDGSVTYYQGPVAGAPPAQAFSRASRGSSHPTRAGVEDHGVPCQRDQGPATGLTRQDLNGRISTVCGWDEDDQCRHVQLAASHLSASSLRSWCRGGLRGRPRGQDAALRHHTRRIDATGHSGWRARRHAASRLARRPRCKRPPTHNLMHRSHHPRHRPPSA